MNEVNYMYTPPTRLSLFGPGFIGGAYFRKYGMEGVMAMARDNHVPMTADVLYFISTVDNYNVLTSSFVDVDTNLTTLLKVLDNWRDRQKETGIYGTFNFVSSWFVYGNQRFPLGVREDDVCDPKGFYSITKRAAEQLLISYCQTFGLKYRILRLGNVLGAGDKKVSAKKNALQYLINRLKTGEEIQLYNDGDFHRDYIHVDDCIAAIRLVITKSADNEIYNIGNGRSYAWKFRDIIYYARRVLNSSSKITSINAKEFHKVVQVETFCMDTTKLILLGYSPQYTMEQVIDSLL